MDGWISNGGVTLLRADLLQANVLLITTQLHYCMFLVVEISILGFQVSIDGMGMLSLFL